MLIMVLAAAQSTRDTSQLSRYYPLLAHFADYLGANGLLPFEQCEATCLPQIATEPL
jgi:hypothetical protein